MNKLKEYYRQRLPHIQPLGAAFFVTFRLYGAIPITEIQKLKQNYLLKQQKLKTIEDERNKNRSIYQLRQDYFLAQESLLENIKSGPHHLKNPDIAKVIYEEIHRFDKKLYELICFTIMSNHVHLVIDTSLPSEYIDEVLTTSESTKPLHQIMKRIKGPTAIKAYRILNKSGQFWDRESFDMYIRNEKMLINVINYTINNPVKAGLVNEWNEWPYTYLATYFSFK